MREHTGDVRHIRELKPNLFVHELRELAEEGRRFYAERPAHGDWANRAEEAANLIEHLQAELDAVRDYQERAEAES